MTFKSRYAGRLEDYVKLRRHLGYRFGTEEAILRLFDRHLKEVAPSGRLSQESALAFATANPKYSANYSAHRYAIVRRFADYLRAFDPRTPIIRPNAHRWKTARPKVHILSEAELDRLLHEALHVSRRFPVRGKTLRVIIGLAASTGLRISEVTALDKTDVDLETGILTIRRTKFDKDRLVPVHPTTLEALREYAARRSASSVNGEPSAFFVNMRSRRFSRNTLQQSFAAAAVRARLRLPSGRGLSFHSLRHLFAVRRLVEWYREGRDVQAMLPALATYMGHVEYTNTAYYLTATPELLAVAAERYQAFLQGRRASDG